jgi:hypothetical protein
VPGASCGFAVYVVHGFERLQTAPTLGEYLRIYTFHAGLAQNQPVTTSAESAEPVRHPHEPVVGPVAPTSEVATELRSFLENDKSRLGDVYRGLNRGLNAEPIAIELGVATSGFVWNYTQIIQSLVDGALPAGPTVALQVARKFRKLLQNSSFSTPSRSFLETNLSELERRANDVRARVVEVQLAQKQTESAEARNETGIYCTCAPPLLALSLRPRHRAHPDESR